MDDTMRSIGALIVSALAWMAAFNVQEIITWLLASALTLASIVYVLIGIHNRLIDREIKRRNLNKLNNES